MSFNPEEAQSYPEIPAWLALWDRLEGFGRNQFYAPASRDTYNLVDLARNTMILDKLQKIGKISPNYSASSIGY